MSSVLVVVVLLGMWAFVLVPLVRQRNVKADEARSVARFSSALRVLSRGHSFSDRPGWAQHTGMRQWVMPPREGLAAVRQRRLASAAPAAVSPAALRRRHLLIGLAGAVTVTLLLAVGVGGAFVVLQLLADCAFAAGIVACRWSVEQERLAASRVRRRRDTSELRTSLESLAPRVQMMTVPLESAAPASMQNMTVPLDAPLLSHRAAPTQVAMPAQHPGVQHPGVRRAAARHIETPAARPVPPRPRAEPVVLAEIDLDWEPAVPEPASCVRLVDLGARSRRTPLFEESPADGVDVGDDAELDALVQRRLTASGW